MQVCQHLNVAALTYRRVGFFGIQSFIHHVQKNKFLNFLVRRSHTSLNLESINFEE